MAYRCRHDAQRMLLFASQGSTELLGCAPEALVGNQAVAFGDLIYPKDRPIVFSEIDAAVAEQRPYRCIYRIVIRNGHQRWVLDKGKPVYQTEDGWVLDGFVTDHTRRMTAFRQLEQRLAEQARKAEKLVVMEERNRLARELHDSVTQSLYSVTLFAEAGRNLARSGQLAQATRYFDDVLETGQQALKEMRLLVHKLRPSALEKGGLVKALQNRLNAVEGRAGVKNQLALEGDIHLPADVEEAIYNVIQEALNNAIKHANASEVGVALRQENDTLALTIWDNGGGFDPVLADESGGLGLISMRERVHMIGGTFDIVSIPGQGTTIEVRLSGDSVPQPASQ